MSESGGWIRSSILGVVLGVFAGGLVVFLVEGAAHALIGTGEPGVPETVTTPMFVSVLVAWVAGAAAAGAVATYWSRASSVAPGGVAGGILLAAAMSNVLVFPHPVWMIATAVVLMPVAAIAAAGSLTRQVAA